MVKTMVGRHVLPLSTIKSVVLLLCFTVCAAFTAFAVLIGAMSQLMVPYLVLMMMRMMKKKKKKMMMMMMMMMPVVSVVSDVLVVEVDHFSTNAYRSCWIVRTTVVLCRFSAHSLVYLG